MYRLFLPFTAIAVLCLLGCGSSEFDGDAIKATIEGTPLNLSAEQVLLNDAQVDCGARDELWNPPNGNVAQLTQKGRDLKFSDDVRLNDPDVRQPYIQISGTFPVQVSDVSRIRNEGDYKLADVKLGVVINHECFQGSPLPLLGIKRGKFSPDQAPVFRFKGSGKEYSFDRLMH